MKNLKKVLASLLVVALMASMAIVPAFAASLSYEKEAEQLYQVGLYKGISTDPNNPNLDLESLLDRQTGVVMLLRLFGQEEEAELLSYEQADALLAKFTDAGTIADWAKRQVAYAVEKGVVKGYEDSTFRPTAGLNGKAYASLLLQQLGYDGEFDYHQAAIKLSQVGGLTASQATVFNSDAQLNKDALVGMSYGALQAKFKADGKKLIKFLIESGVVEEEKVKEAGIPYADIVSVAEIPDITVDIGATPELPATVTATYDNGTTAEVAVTWPTVDTSVAGEQVITGTIADTDVTAKVKVIVVPAELKVEGKASGNLVELVLNFNRPVPDEDEAKDVSNYKVKKYTVKNASLSEDKTTVTLLLASPVAQQSDVTVTVAKEVGFDEDVELTIKNVKDTAAPEVVSVEAVGNGLVKVTFSEPVKNATSIANFLVDGKIITSSQPTLTSDEKTVNFKLTKRLTPGEHKLVVKNKVVDYAGFAIEDNETEFTVVEDTTPPTGEIVSATQTKVVIKFSEPVEEPDEDDVDTNTSAEIIKAELDDDDMTYTIEFDVEKALPTAGGKITIKNLTDYSGNKVNFEIAVSPTYDVERPEFVGYTVDDKQVKIILEFNEEVFEDKGEFTLVDEDDDEIALKAPVYYVNDNGKTIKSKLVLTRADNSAFDSGKYKLTIEDVTDLNPLKNTIIKTTVDITVDDQKAPNVKYVYIKSSDNALYVEFNEEVDEATATDYDNYAYMLNTANATFNDLDKDVADLELLSDGKTVRIEFETTGDDAVDVDDIARLQVTSVADTAGNEMKAQAIDSSAFRLVTDALVPKIDSAAVTDKNTIVVKLTTGSSINDRTLNPGDFILTAGQDDKGKDIVITAWDAEYDSDDNEITLTVDKDISADATYKGNAIKLKLANDVETVNAFDQALEIDGATILTVADEYAPTAADSVASAVYTSGVGTEVFIELSENLNLAGAVDSNGKITDADYLTQFRIKADSKIVAADIYYFDAASTDNKSTDVDETKARFKVVIAGNYKGKTVQVLYMEATGKTIKDTSVKGNALKDFDLSKKVK
ncbi:Ig-like domain-containing protein [Acetivibrio clariflavus]|uniref:Ig-like domain-containing protein,putative S-layer protein n=1 Tax=Acetivibrio clariflavus (strain DSM 19732 / NBRC 101661 / EBR45) TaxID=720554 RepID=G8LUI2_ACECE|nr:Ig-like domain-containing protein [Acetivibrio clariflavus]AEV70630.1 Ig-like domain-containing protein,putative S-layer protein [Acetivibrio clariflavus DSM 19732]